MRRGIRLAAGFLLLGLAAAFPAAAQSTLEWPVGEFQDYKLDSDRVMNLSGEQNVAFGSLVTVPDAAWMRLYFDLALLEEGSFLRMTSALDGEVQELDATGIDMWNNTSAYFNGDAVYLELIAGPNTTENRVVLDRVAVQFASAALGPCADDDCGMCGTDERVLSNVNWSGRILPVGCSGSVFNEDSCLVSAGHCADGGYDTTIQFNVPASSSSCAINHPPVADQFPITAHMFLNGGVGADWSVMTTGTNSLGQTIYERYGLMRPIATALGSSGNPVAVWGFGVDNSNPTRSQDQQTSDGTIGSRYSTYYTHDVDITYGNSGSALIRNDEIVGIITHCSFTCDNIATRVDLSDFASARDSLCGGGGGYCAATSNSTSYEYISNVTVGTINNSSGSSGYADYTGMSTDMQIGTGYAFALTIGSAYSSDIGGLWVDWNQDEDFSDANETITTSWSGATLGATRLRVRIQDGDFDPSLNPCGSTSYGEVEDYTVNVTSGGPSDTTPPSPDPMQWQTAPYATSTTAVSMMGVTATDADSPPVEYQFWSSESAGSSYGTSRSFSESGLSVNTYYYYYVRARDSAATPNETEWSPLGAVYTLANVPGTPTVDNPTTSTLDVDVNTNGNPSGTQFAIYCPTTGQYVQVGGSLGGTEAWQTDAQWGTTTVSGLSSDTEYCFRVKARNGDDIETALGSQACATTGSGGTPDITVAITSSMTEVPRNSNFVFSVWVTNNETTSQTVQVWTAAQRASGGAMFEPLKGPVTLSLNPGQTRSFTNLPQHIGSVPLTTYNYYARVGTSPSGTIYDEDYVSFTVVP